MNNLKADQRFQKIKPFEKKIWLSSPTMHGEELEYIKEAYNLNWMSTVGKNIDEGTRLIYEEYEREGKQIGSIAVLEPSYDQWGRMGKIAGQTYVGEKMFDRFTTAPQGVQIGALISEMLKKRN